MTQESNPDRSLLPGKILLWFSAITLLILLVCSWSMPPVDASGFRQTQTALSIDWLLRGGPWLDYVTPVLGAPWSIPFEFPFYQWLAALLSSITGMSADNSGRLVSTSSMPAASGWSTARCWRGVLTARWRCASPALLPSRRTRSSGGAR